MTQIFELNFVKRLREEEEVDQTIFKIPISIIRGFSLLFLREVHLELISEL